MSEQNDKTPDQVSDEDYKVAPTSADVERLKKHNAASQNEEEEEEQRLQATGENYQLPTDTKMKEELREGVEQTTQRQSTKYIENHHNHRIA